MATKELKLAIEQRTKTGTTDAHKLRANGRIPAVLYGHGSEPLHVSLEARAFDEVMIKAGRNGIITLTMDGKTADTALVRDIARNPVTRGIQHVDLQRVGVHEAVHAKLPLVTVGVAPGVKDFGGVLDLLVHELDVEGPADEIPAHLEIDVSALGIHQHVTAADVKLPKGFRLLTPPDTNIVSIEASKTAQHLEEAPATEQATPERIGGAPESA